FVASTFKNGASASLAKRRAISVLPQPVGPIMRMFFGSTSSRIASSSCWRRQRFLSAIATARLASCWPTMKRSSSETISRGLNADAAGAAMTGLGMLVMDGPDKITGVGEIRKIRARGAQLVFSPAPVRFLKSFDGNLVVGVDAEIGRDLERLPRNRLGVELGFGHHRARGGEREGAARADADELIRGLDDVAGAGQHQGNVFVGHRHHRLEPAKVAVGAPILGELDAGARQLARMLLELAFEPLEQRERIGGAT